VICSKSANAVIAAKPVKPKGLLMAEQYIGDFKTSVRFEPFLLSLKSNLSTERRAAIGSSGAGKDTGMPGLMMCIHSAYQRGLTAWIFSEEEI